MYCADSLYSMRNHIDLSSTTMETLSPYEPGKYSLTPSNHVYCTKRAYKGDKPYRCDVCRKGFCRRSNLSNHEESSVRHFYCIYCRKAFSQRAHLKTHEITHTGLKPYSCEFCSKTFAQRANYDNHRRIHTGERPYHCSWCPKAFAQLTNLNNHLRIHTGERPFVCSLCLKGFSQVTNLRNHQRIHSGEKPFICGFCTKAFSQVTHLRNHERVHTGEKPYSCPTCLKSFSQRSNLDSHKRVHTGEKPYSCPDCKKCFSQVTNLRNHQRIHAIPSSHNSVDKSITTAVTTTATTITNVETAADKTNHYYTIANGNNYRKAYSSQQYSSLKHQPHLYTTSSSGSQACSSPNELNIRTMYPPVPPPLPTQQQQQSLPPPSPLPLLPSTSPNTICPKPITIPNWMTPSSYVQQMTPSWENSYYWTSPSFPAPSSRWSSCGSQNIQNLMASDIGQKQPWR